MTVLVTPNLGMAIANANEWVNEAKPVIRAFFALDEAGLALFDASDRIREEGRDILRKPRRELSDMIEGIRDNYRCDFCAHGTSDMTDAEWDAVEEFNDELERGMVSVAAAIREVENEA